MTKTRQAIVGERIRRKNQEQIQDQMKCKEEEIRGFKKMLTIKDEELKVVSREKEEVKLKYERVEEENFRLKKKHAEEDKWFKIVYFELSPDERRSVKGAVFRNKHRLPIGTLQRLRLSTNVNFSQIPAQTNYVMPEIAKCIAEYAERNSSEVPNERANPSSIGVNGYWKLTL